MGERKTNLKKSEKVKKGGGRWGKVGEKSEKTKNVEKSRERRKPPSNLRLTSVYLRLERRGKVMEMRGRKGKGGGRRGKEKKGGGRTGKRERRGEEGRRVKGKQRMGKEG